MYFFILDFEITQNNNFKKTYDYMFVVHASVLSCDLFLDFLKRYTSPAAFNTLCLN